MISKEQVVKIHQILIKRFGGIQGIRDLSMLESSIERPNSGIEDKEFYPTPEEKAAAVIESIITNHPFNDGNKRTGYVLMRLILLEYNLDIDASGSEKYKFVMEIASGNRDYDSILNWIRSRIRKT